MWNLEFCQCRRTYGGLFKSTLHKQVQYCRLRRGILPSLAGGGAAHYLRRWEESQRRASRAASVPRADLSTYPAWLAVHRLQLPGPPRPERICVPFAPHGLPQYLRRDRALPGYLAAASDIFCSITYHARLEALPLARFSVDQCALLCLPERSSAVKLGRVSSDFRVDAC